MRATHIVVVCCPHFEPAISLGDTATITIADDVFERVASSPLTTVSSNITLHCVCSSKVIPRTNKLNCLNRGVGFPASPLARGNFLVE